jgi:hypothetical protein
VLINVDKEGKMELDEQFLINFDGICAAEPTSPTTGMEQQQRNGGGGGGLLMKKVGAPQGGFCLREMRFLNGDSTSDCISIS